MVQELRSLKPVNSACVASCDDGSLRDSRITRCSTRMGPFKTIQEFHLWLRNDFKLSEIESPHDPKWQGIAEMVTMQDGSWPPPIFTHGDLNPSNVLIYRDKVVGIIDWEFSGWYPHYWEYTSAWLNNLTNTEWQSCLHKFLEPFPKQLEMEKTRQNWWGEW